MIDDVVAADDTVVMGGVDAVVTLVNLARTPVSGGEWLPWVMGAWSAALAVPQAG